MFFSRFRIIGRTSSETTGRTTGTFVCRIYETVSKARRRQGHGIIRKAFTALGPVFVIIHRKTGYARMTRREALLLLARSAAAYPLLRSGLFAQTQSGPAPAPAQAEAAESSPQRRRLPGRDRPPRVSLFLERGQSAHGTGSRPRFGQRRTRQAHHRQHCRHRLRSRCTERSGMLAATCQSTRSAHAWSPR